MDRHTTSRRVISLDEDLWNELGEAVGDRGRSAVIRELVAAYLGRPGAKMPRRPAGSAR